MHPAVIGVNVLISGGRLLVSELTELLSRQLIVLSEQIHLQTVAIQALADSNMALVQAMSDADECDDDCPPLQYLSGQPVR